MNLPNSKNSVIIHINCIIWVWPWSNQGDAQAQIKNGGENADEPGKNK